MMDWRRIKRISLYNHGLNDAATKPFYSNNRVYESNATNNLIGFHSLILIREYAHFNFVTDPMITHLFCLVGNELRSALL